VRSCLSRLIDTCLVGLLCSLTPTRGGDWPQWRGPERDGAAAADEIPLSNLPPDPRPLWRLQIGAGWASPVVSQGRLYYLDAQDHHERLHAVHASDGKEIWRAELDSVMHDEQGPDGPRTTPLVAGDRIYAQSSLGELQSRRIADGTLVWRTNFRTNFAAPWLGEDSVIPGAAEHGYTGSPVLVGDRLVAGVGATNGAGLVAFHAKTGKVLWQSQNDLAAYASPIRATLDQEVQVIAFTVTGLLSVSPNDGRVLWRFPLRSSYGRNCLTPVVTGDVVITGTYQSGLLGVQVRRAGANWVATALWTNTAATMNFTSPVAVGNWIYGVGPDRNLVCVEAPTGRLVWQHREPFWGAAGQSYGALVRLGSRLLVTTDAGEAILLSALGASTTELGRAQIGGRTWSAPAYADGLLYFRDGVTGPGILRAVRVAPE